MVKTSPKKRASIALTPKKKSRNARNKYLRPGALAQIRNTRVTTRSCMDIRKKRVVLDSEKANIDLVNKKNVALQGSPRVSPYRTTFESVVGLTDGSRPQKLPTTPKTPQMEDVDSQSRLESLPLDLLVKIICHLHHDQLRAVFHVSQRIRKAVLIARQCYFNYTTPDRSRLEMLSTKTPLPTEHWPFVSRGNDMGALVLSPRTPKAPRHGPRPPSRLNVLEMRQIAAVLFQETTFSSRVIVPPGLPRPVFKPLSSNRVLFYEEELCKAVADNKLR
ncbi:F-box protein [Acorus calamus]|uniref:F-box protein n=1 Tax=Acorus calamus TaxID=4465 RepID=A0AAV9DS65_ACOCL|nr:F-box protein [Acorus calamus]